MTGLEHSPQQKVIKFLKDHPGEWFMAYEIKNHTGVPKRHVGTLVVGHPDGRIGTRKDEDGKKQTVYSAISSEEMPIRTDLGESS